MKRLLLVLLYFFSLENGEASNPKSLEWIQDIRFHAFTNPVIYEHQVFVLGQSKDNKGIYFFVLNTNTLDTNYIPLEIVGHESIFTNKPIKLGSDSLGNFFIFFPETSAFYTTYKNTNNIYVLNKVSFPTSFQKQLSGSPYDNFFSSNDSFYFYYSHSPAYKKDCFSKVLSINRKNKGFNERIIIKEISGSFCSLFQPFQLVDLNDKYLVMPSENLSKIIVSDRVNGRDTSLFFNHDYLSKILYDQIDQCKKKYFVTEDFQYMQKLDTLNSKLNRYANIRLFENYLLVHYQKMSENESIVPDYFFDIYRLHSDVSGIRFQNIASEMQDFSTCYYRSNCNLDSALDTVNFFVTNLLKSKMNICILGEKLIIVDNLIAAPASYRTAREFLKASENEQKIFSIAVYTFCQ